MEATLVYAVGHLALGYVAGRAASRLLRVKVALPFLFAVSLLPDLDLLVPGLAHRGPLHSVVVAMGLFLPLFVLMRRMAVPYFVACVQHLLVGDLLTGESLQLFWPLTTHGFGPGLVDPASGVLVSIPLTSTVNIAAEWALFLGSLAVLVASSDVDALLQPHRTKGSLVVPLFALVLPTFLRRPLPVPGLLVIPHLVYLVFLVLVLLPDLLVLGRLLRASLGSRTFSVG